MDKNTVKAKKIILDKMRENRLKVRKIILFGSRVKGNYRVDSDWDFMIIIEEKLTFAEKAKITAVVKRKLLENNFPNDVIIKYYRDYEEGSNYCRITA